MIGKQSQPDDSEDNKLRIKLITDKRKFLEEKYAQIENEIRSCFKELAEVLQTREKQLLRQAEAIYRQQLSLVETSLDFLPSSLVVLDNRSELEKKIRQFGNIEVHGSNGITVKDVEPYKVADYQDANNDHVSFDKSITCKKTQDLTLPRCKDLISDYKTLHSSDLPLSFLVENKSQSSQNVKDNDALMTFKDSLFLSGWSPFLIIKRKLGLAHVSLDGLHAFDKAYPRNVRSFDTPCDTTKSCELNILTHKTAGVNLRNNDKKILNKDKEDSELSAYTKEKQDNNYEHPIQVQHWLRQILAETEIEPAIHEIGQFSEISKAKLYNGL
ncbi:uncharacterized protein LOC109857589 isoform X1 [Pseudomyrmex gracilis]|uniref:uncharacterized protein LOC109857589 isoform X1 n=1 Tax=Pseudomyrmex gracilis TaxID=219809 RepID=UPI000994A032|nr:uncharacterized protein LOC109857589 isoform X1 [Pseudomyrmex gracilis]